MRKFWPSLLLASSPWASKRPRRYESVCRGEGTGGEGGGCGVSGMWLRANGLGKLVKPRRVPLRTGFTGSADHPPKW